MIAGAGLPSILTTCSDRPVVALVILGAVVTLAAFWPRPFSAPADPFAVPPTLPPLGIPATILVGAGRLPGGLGLVGLQFLAILPLVDRSKGGGLGRRSRHGQRLLVEGDTVAPSCTSCHGAHAIFPRVDPRSPVNPERVSETCAGCHTDPRRFSGSLGTTQYAEWAASAHGVALIQRHNDRSANCTSCHGSHSALAPGVREIPNVCGKCHQLVREAYFAGAHREQIAGSTLEAGCTGCHENHGTEMPPFSAIAGLCQDCHGEDSPQATAGLELQQQILRAEAAGERGREGVSILSQAGERTEDEDIRLQAMETHLRELMVVAHTLDPVIVEDLSRRIVSLSGEISERAESVDEHRWERKLLAIPFWVLALAGILLALRKRRVLLRHVSGAEAVDVGESS